jgi:hypothetical protein
MLSFIVAIRLGGTQVVAHRLIVDLKVIYQWKGLQGLDKGLRASAHLLNHWSDAAEGDPQEACRCIALECWDGQLGGSLTWRGRSNKRRFVARAVLSWRRFRTGRMGDRAIVGHLQGSATF